MSDSVAEESTIAVWQGKLVLWRHHRNDVDNALVKELCD